ncbi:Uu.00g125920.m01.CDS01 [Anthostomella pinea]|uniref:Uu.00g125920.m01.CDS01 n=1 Tax=Anthostomella pinea TaxID=933095 RepID=A0AAI8VHS6_9PEZI|nr:Uu.00g125920.m01.CDS01 [Anthostomella pinea]
MDRDSITVGEDDLTTPQNEKAQRPSHTSSDTIVAVLDDSIPHKDSPDSEPVVVLPTPYTVHTQGAKRLIVASAAFSALFASWTAQIYLPALKIAADDLHTSVQKINLTVTSYMIFQGVSPIFIAGYADTSGRRPVYITCFILYIAVNIALALSDSYGSLFAFRILQSATISATQALCQGVVADVATSSERGQYTAFLALPVTLGPSIGPVIGGAIATYLGWRNIFWFLTICAVINLGILFCFFPETCRTVVGDGSILPRKRNQTVRQLLQNRKKKSGSDPENTITITASLEAAAPKPASAWTRFRTSLLLLVEKELSLLFLYGGLLFAGVYAVATAVPSLFADIYGFDGLKIGLIYLPLAAGSIVSVVLTGKALNWNFQRHAKRLGLEVDKDRQMDLIDFPIEKARIEVVIPPLILSFVVITAWGWALDTQVSIGIICVLVFLLGLGLVSVTSVFNALIADIRPGKTGAAAAGNNIVKFLLSAAMSASINPLIQATGPGKAYSIIATFYVLLSPLLYLVVRNGMKWRRQLRDKEGGRE